MAIDTHVLSSLAASLEELTARLGQLNVSLSEDDDAGLELAEVERQLHTASRRVNKILHQIRE